MMRHGECKTSGGKLIAVDFDIADGTLRNVVVTGDFFLYPEEALGPLANSLEGMPASMTEEDYAARVRTALSEGVELLGSSPEALATAVIRALRSPEKGTATHDA